jgi:hypothetical protein
MPTIIKLFLILAAIANAQTYTIMGLNMTAGTQIICTTNAAANYCGALWTTDTAKTLNAVRLFMSSATGTVAIGQLQLDIYASAAGAPTGSSLATAASTVAGSAAWQVWSGLSLSLSANTGYWFVVRNLNATPASNFVTIRAFQHLLGSLGGGRILTSSLASSTNSGSSWTSNANATPVIRLDFSDSTSAGSLFESVVTAVNSNYRVWGTREW